MDKYEDIINLPHPVSKKHPRMSLYDRAAQFSPFAALTGHNAAIIETARLTEKKIRQSEDAISILNEKLHIITENPGAEVTITYFLPDDRKEGGAYVRYTGAVKKIDRYVNSVVMTDGTVIPVEDISEIEGEMFGDDIEYSL
ncbi:MAG TPA: hypothetical protein IAA36_06045 [Candidatus Eubacterium pullicola]|nr:hypothetical protein [Candidatus Eubacterium pullicola]